MRFFCAHCDARISTQHHWEGLSVICPNCGKSTKLSYRMGQSIPWTGASVTFSDFQQLLTDKAYSEAIYPVIREILGCSIERTEAGVKLLDEDGALIPLEVAHLEIQLNPESRRRIYNAAMNLWR